MNAVAIGQGLSAIVVGIIGVAIVSVIVSRHANSAGLVTAAGNTLSKVIGAAVIPMTQESVGSNLGNSAFSSPASVLSSVGSAGPVSLSNVASLFN